ncbi:MAG: adenosylmethionine decarboxylase [Candidatus Latescibacteria bacterium]|nr:adenosylmethionine decarboxylase [Candidatus Latescibacterota bacterium]
MEALGRHVLVDFYGCSPALLDDAGHLEQALNQAALAAGARVLNSTFHRFSPCGVTGVLAIQESHLAIHTWPEHAFAAVDLFTCGQALDPWQACALLKKALGAAQGKAVELHRGQLVLQAQQREI